MQSLAELEDENTFQRFADEAVALTREKAGVATAQHGFGGNSGAQGGDDDRSANVDAWFSGARWS